MCSKISSEVVVLPKEFAQNNCALERELSRVYGEIIRWAIVELRMDTIKINVSYKVDAE